MRNILFVALTIISIPLTAQTRADSISIVFPKLLILNQQQEILLEYDSSRKAYEVPSTGFLEGPTSFRNYVDKAAAEIGFAYSKFTIGGIFTYVHPKRYNTYIRPYFVLQFDQYLHQKTFADQRYKWFHLQQALAEIKYPASRLIVEKIIQQPAAQWTATFEEYGYTNPVDTSKIKFRIIEDFYTIK
ncbi:hypothetical protein [Chitinophaga sp. sic0106]|uniref:hypothetical protein n=1 Tax=Chitinophaga sp. sic0106 TaxID=2854785 RepID=UPI001C48AF2B|nr:hypothetical protein [Chitinophaga sp. sic0106]MBV7530608.1 hypothetical protein [Chitinophaga sp. sic0106]